MLNLTRVMFEVTQVMFEMKRLVLNARGT